MAESNGGASEILVFVTAERKLTLATGGSLTKGERSNEAVTLLVQRRLPNHHVILGDGAKAKRQVSALSPSRSDNFGIVDDSDTMKYFDRVISKQEAGTFLLRPDQSSEDNSLWVALRAQVL